MPYQTGPDDGAGAVRATGASEHWSSFGNQPLPDQREAEMADENRVSDKQIPADQIEKRGGIVQEVIVPIAQAGAGGARGRGRKRVRQPQAEPAEGSAAREEGQLRGVVSPTQLVSLRRDCVGA